MSHSQQALIIEELWSETQRLNAEITALQTRLSRYEAIKYFTPDAEPNTRGEKTESEPDAWGVWPYCWAISAHRYLSDRFHSFHERLVEARLVRANRRAHEAFWEQPYYEDTALKLI
jgi:hypothetical protein